MKKFNQSSLPYIAAIVQALMFSYVGIKYFGAWGWLIGPGVGAVVSLSLTVASSRISDIAQKRQGLARAMYCILFVLSPATIALTLYMPESPFTAIAWAAAPDFAIGLAGSVAGGSLIAKEKPATSGAKPKRKREKPAESPLEPALAEPKPAFVCSCGYEAKTQPALNAHQRKHKQIAGYAVSFEPIQKEQASK